MRLGGRKTHKLVSCEQQYVGFLFFDDTEGGVGFLLTNVPDVSVAKSRHIFFDKGRVVTAKILEKLENLLFVSVQTKGGVGVLHTNWNRINNDREPVPHKG